MATPVRTIKDLRNKINSDIFVSTSGEIDPSQDPFYNAVSESLGKILNATDNAIRDSYYQSFPQTATTEEALSLISYKDTNNKIQRKSAQFATGKVLVVATESVDIPVGTQFITQDGNLYESIIYRSCVTQTISIESLERVGNYAIATITGHNLGNLMTLTISGANEAAFNGDAEIQIVDEDTIKWANTGDDETATGTIIATFLGCRVEVQSLSTGEDANKDYSTVIDLSSSITEVSDTFITYDGFVDGADIETLASWKARLLDYFTYPENHGNLYYQNYWITQNTDPNFCYTFNSEDSLYLYLTSVVSSIDDNYDFTDYTTDELAAIRSEVINNNKFSLSGVSALQFTVVNPTFVEIDIDIEDLSPLSTAMKEAISDTLKQYLALLPINFFLKSSQISVDKIRSVLSTVRDSTGKIPSFGTVTVGNVSSLDANIKKPILGDITYS